MDLNRVVVREDEEGDWVRKLPSLLTTGPKHLGDAVVIVHHLSKSQSHSPLILSLSPLSFSPLSFSPLLSLPLLSNSSIFCHFAQATELLGEMTQ